MHGRIENADEIFEGRVCSPSTGASLAYRTLTHEIAKCVFRAGSDGVVRPAARMIPLCIVDQLTVPSPPSQLTDALFDLDMIELHCFCTALIALDFTAQDT